MTDGTRTATWAVAPILGTRDVRAATAHDRGATISRPLVDISSAVFLVLRKRVADLEPGRL